MSNRSVEVLTRVVAIAGLTAGCSQIEGLQGTNKPFEVNFSKKTVDSYSPEIAKNININLDNIGSQFAGKYGESYVKDSQGYLFGKNSSGEVFLYSYGNVKGLDEEEVTEWGVVNWADNTVKSDAEIFQPVVKTDNGDIGYFQGEEFVSVMVARDDGKYDLVDPEGNVVSNLAAEEINFWKIKAVQAGALNPVTGETATIEPTVAPTETATIEPTAESIKVETWDSMEVEQLERKVNVILSVEDDKFIKSFLETNWKISEVEINRNNPNIQERLGLLIFNGLLDAYNYQNKTNINMDEFVNGMNEGKDFEINIAVREDGQIISQKINLAKVKTVEGRLVSPLEGELYVSSYLAASPFGFEFDENSGKLVIKYFPSFTETDKSFIDSALYKDNLVIKLSAIKGQQINLLFHGLLALIFSTDFAIDQKDWNEIGDKVLKELAILAEKSLYPIDNGINKNPKFSDYLSVEGEFLKSTIAGTDFINAYVLFLVNEGFWRAK